MHTVYTIHWVSAPFYHTYRNQWGFYNVCRKYRYIVDTFCTRQQQYFNPCNVYTSEKACAVQQSMKHVHAHESMNYWATRADLRVFRKPLNPPPPTHKSLVVYVVVNVHTAYALYTMVHARVYMLCNCTVSLAPCCVFDTAPYMYMRSPNI